MLVAVAAGMIFLPFYKILILPILSDNKYYSKIILYF